MSIYKIKKNSKNVIIFLVIVTNSISTRTFILIFKERTIKLLLIKDKINTR